MAHICNRNLTWFETYDPDKVPQKGSMKGYILPDLIVLPPLIGIKTSYVHHVFSLYLCCGGERLDIFS